jgi:hypothetical protein
VSRFGNQASLTGFSSAWFFALSLTTFSTATPAAELGVTAATFSSPTRSTGSRWHVMPVFVMNSRHRSRKMELATFRSTWPFKWGLCWETNSNGAMILPQK